MYRHDNEPLPSCQTILNAPENTDAPFKSITDALAVPLEEVAAAVGKSYGTVAAYRIGKREPPPEVWDRLADFIDTHRGRLPAVARLCRQYAKRS